MVKLVGLLLKLKKVGLIEKRDPSNSVGLQDGFPSSTHLTISQKIKINGKIMKKIICIALVLFSSHYANADSKKMAFFTNTKESINILPSQLDFGIKFTSAYNKLNAKKDEFETEAQYQTRLNGLNDGTYYFLGDINDFNESNISYDAENKKFILEKLVFTDLNSSERSFTVKIQLPLDMKEKGNYIASNAYGAKAKVKKVDIISRTLLLNKKDTTGGLFTYIVGEANIDATTAKIIKNKLKILYVGKAKFSDVKVENSHISPNLNSRLDGEKTEYFIPFNLEGLYLYDNANNKILAPLSIQY